ncbi:MAG: MYXO-CTERM sorting domain-containing protein [Polyangiaceae bacterium]
MKTFALRAATAAALAAIFAGAPAARAEPIWVSKQGVFPQRAGVLSTAAEAVLHDQVPESRALAFGEPRLMTLASGDQAIRLPQMHQGLRVVHRGATVVVRGSSARFVAAKLETDLPSDVVPSFSAEYAAELARERTGLTPAPDHTLLVLWPTANGVRLAWAMASPAEIGFPYLPVTVVDAETGDIILVYDALVSLNQAQVFPTNPVKSPTLQDVTLSVGTGETVLTSSLVKAMNCIDQGTVRSVDVGVVVDIHSCDLLQTAVADANGDFLVPVAADNAPEDTFAEVSIFYHAARAYERFRSFSPALDLNGGAPLSAISNLRIPQGLQPYDPNKLKNPNLPLLPLQNAFFAPADPLFAAVYGLGGGALWFGQGPIKDYSYDGDVVYHELTHAVVHATIQLVGTPHMDEYGTSYSPGAMNEGLADYFSSALTGDPDVGEYAAQDFDPGSTSIRSLTSQDSCPTAIGGEVHQDATLFSAALWDVRASLDPTDQLALDGAILGALATSPTGDLSYDELATLIVAETNSALGSGAAQALTDAFTNRGVLPECARVLEYVGEALKGPQALGSLWFAPGTQTTGAVNPTDGWTPGVVQAHYALPADTTKLDIQFRPVNVGAVGMGTPFTPKVLVRFGNEPITFTYNPTATAADVRVASADAMPSGYVASVDVPAGATSAHVMVVNTGQLDGGYTDLTLVATVNMQTGAGGAGGATGNGVGGAMGGSGGAGGGTSPDGDSEDGCGCSTIGGARVELSGWMLLASAVLAMQRVLRRRRPEDQDAISKGEQELTADERPIVR